MVDTEVYTSIYIYWLVMILVDLYVLLIEDYKLAAEMQSLICWLSFMVQYMDYNSYIC